MSTTFFTFQKNVTTSGTPVQLNNMPVDPDQSVLVKAKTANTGDITVGNSSAGALKSGSSFVRLAPGDSVILSVRNANEIWIDSFVNGEGVEVGIT